MSDGLHIVSFNIPSPPDYGGVIDVYHKIRSLHEAGVKIHLHTFAYGGRQINEELKSYCAIIDVYDRPLYPWRLFSSLPFIVATRRDPLLLFNLQRDQDPILFEGLHSCYFLNHRSLTGRKRLVRAHNIEHEYYDALSLNEKNILKNLYLRQEALKLHRFETHLQGADKILAISENDHHYFENAFPGKSISIPAFHPFDHMEIPDGTGDYCLFHGNLSVSENQEAVRFLIDEVFSKLPYPLVIAGKNPDDSMLMKARAFQHISVIENPSSQKMDELISKAQIHVLPSFQSTGIKLKLIHSLFRGRHVIVNPDMVKGSGLDSLCGVANTAEDMISLIHKCMNIPVADSELDRRRMMLSYQFNNSDNAKKIISLLK